jgi:hypothetical protein
VDYTVSYGIDSGEADLSRKASQRKLRRGLDVRGLDRLRAAQLPARLEPQVRVTADAVDLSRRDTLPGVMALFEQLELQARASGVNRQDVHGVSSRNGLSGSRAGRWSDKLTTNGERELTTNENG